MINSLYSRLTFTSTVGVNHITRRLPTIIAIHILMLFIS